MTEETATSPPPTPTPENARGMLLNAAVEFRDADGEEQQQQLLDILRNNNKDCRDVFATCVNEFHVIEAFTWACKRRGNLQLLQAFHDIGMNVDVEDSFTTNPLMIAASNNQKEYIRWLLDHNANVNYQDNYKNTAMMSAAFNGNTDIVEMLLEKNPNVNIQNQGGWTILMLASLYDHVETVRLLLKYDVDIDLKNMEGQTALSLAQNKQIQELLQNHASSYVLK